MIRVFNDNKNICECCDNDSAVLIDFTEDTKPSNLGLGCIYVKNVKEI